MRDETDGRGKDTPMRRKLFSSLIGRKMFMALTGLILYGFLIGHLAGNVLLFNRDGGQAFNAYSGFLNHHPLLVPTELFLLAVFILHIYSSISVTLANRRARPIGYRVRSRAVGGRTWASSTMPYSGILVLIFVVIHVKTFKYGDLGTGTLYDLVSATFHKPGYLIWYVLAMAVLGFHLCHAFQSALQTLGFSAQGLKRIGFFLSLALALGFGLIPIYMSTLM
jgi:succinate dehydrogenase / fumarate reductase cytochrome b subunit